MAYFVATKGWRLALRIFSGIVFLPGVISCIILLPPRKKSNDSVSPQTGERLALYHVCERDQGSGDHNINDEKSRNVNDAQSLSGDGQVQIVPPKDQGDSLSKAQGSKSVCRFCVKSREEDEDGELKGEEIERTAVEMKMSKNPVTYFFSVALATLSLAWTFFNVNLVSFLDWEILWVIKPMHSFTYSVFLVADNGDSSHTFSCVLLMAFAYVLASIG